MACNAAITQQQTLVLATVVPIQLHAKVHGESRRVAQVLETCRRMGDPDGVQIPGPATAIATVWGVNWYMEISLSPLSSLCLSNKYSKFLFLTQLHLTFIFKEFWLLIKLSRVWFPLGKREGVGL